MYCLLNGKWSIKHVVQRTNLRKLCVHLSRGLNCIKNRKCFSSLFWERLYVEKGMKKKACWTKEMWIKRNGHPQNNNNNKKTTAATPTTEEKWKFRCIRDDSNKESEFYTHILCNRTRKRHTFFLFICRQDTVCVWIGWLGCKNSIAKNFIVLSFKLYRMGFIV